MLSCKQVTVLEGGSRAGHLDLGEDLYLQPPVFLGHQRSSNHCPTGTHPCPPACCKGPGSLHPATSKAEGTRTMLPSIGKKTTSYKPHWNKDKT